MAVKMFGPICLVCLSLVQAEVLVYEIRTGHEVRAFQSAPAQFGKALPDEGLTGFVILANPLNGCGSIQPPPPKRSRPLDYFALISRHDCAFEDKVRHAQEANYTAAIIFNPESDRLIPMGGSDSSLIPSMFLGRTDSQLIRKHYLYPDRQDVYILLTDDDAFDINAYLLPFAIVIGVCFTIMLSVVLYKCIQDHRRSRRHRLPKSALKRLPLIKFKTGDPYETCCICLEDFEEGDKLRILPCDHGYHYKCIDPWLLKNKRICPQCRKRVFGGPESDEEDTDDERAPLLARRAGPSSGGTFQSASLGGAIPRASARAGPSRINTNRAGRSSLPPSMEDPAINSPANEIGGTRSYPSPSTIRVTVSVEPNLPNSEIQSEETSGDVHA